MSAVVVSNVGADAPAAPSVPILEVRELLIAFPVLSGVVLPANRLSFSMRRGDILGIVGESASGKSVTVRSLMSLVPWPGEVVDGSILWRGREVTQMSNRELTALRGSEIAMVFQDPLTTLNPVLTIGDQLSETVRIKTRLRGRHASVRTRELLESVRIPSARLRLSSYPHELSGGMRQRVALALALAGDPDLLIADEPTTALDVTTQAQILDLLVALRDERGMAILLVSHDLGVIAQTCDEVLVMYAGYRIEQGSVKDVIEAPQHPYTRALLAAVPSLDDVRVKRPLSAIPGQPPILNALPAGCPFSPRCPFARAACTTIDMTLVGDAHLTACPFERDPLQA
jgi:oligopeptide/dipeptide ABC transporter ATP-binding protein